MERSRVDAIGTEAEGRHGMVTSLHPAAAEAASATLRAGGSAHDAAIAALATLAVVEPFMSGLGGHGAAVIAAPGSDVVVVDASASGPAGAHPGRDVPTRGTGAVPVPTALAGWLGLHAHGGRAPLATLLGPAAALAREGYPAAWYTALMIASHARLLRDDPAASRLFLGPDGLPPAAAATFRDTADITPNPDLAATLDSVARDGLDALTSGPLGDAIASATVTGVLRRTDLAGVRQRAPYAALTSTFRDWEVASGPVTSGASSLIAILHQLEDLDPDVVPLGSAAYFERMLDAQLVAAADRHVLGDPDFANVPLEALLSRELADLRRDDVASRGKAPLPRRALDVPGYPVIAPAAPAATISERTSTTHVNVLAPDGTAIAATFTLGYPFGAAVVAPGTGSLLGNTLHQFTASAGHPNAVAAGKRAAWNGAPTILRRGSETISVGAPGGERIAGAVAQVIVAHLVYGLSPQRAIEVPRAFAAGDSVLIDDRVDPAAAADLEARGRALQLIKEGPFTSNFARPGLIRRYEDGRLSGGIDPWRLGTVIAW